MKSRSKVKRKIKIASIVGARPQFIKLAPFCRAVKNFSQFKHIIIHTGQHYDYNMSRIFFRELMLPEPDYHLGIGSGPREKQIVRMAERIGNALEKERPSWVLVYGDTNSTLAGALAAVNKRIPIIHVEAGLRSFNYAMPEEINRSITDHCSSILICPTKTAVKNLKRENIQNSRAGFPIVKNFGDIMYDAYKFSMSIARSRSRILKKFSLKPQGYYLATIHRAENTALKSHLLKMIKALYAIAEDKPVIFPVHPRTLKLLKAIPLPDKTNLKCIGPVGYFDMLILEKNARCILTDSGGVQKEAYFSKVPCVTMRNETEWVETVKSGWNTLAGVDPRRIVEAAQKASKGKSSADFGDGTASTKILRIIQRLKEPGVQQH